MNKVTSPTLIFITAILSGCASSPTRTADEPTRVSSPEEKGNEDAGTADLSTSTRVGAITYMSGGTIFQLDVRKGAKPTNLSLEMDKLSRGEDEFVMVSRNGKFITTSTTRFSKKCTGWPCLAVVAGDASKADSVVAGGKVIRPSGPSAISNDGKKIVFASSEGPHEQDLFLLVRNDEEWESPVLITGISSHSYNTSPVLSASGDRVLYDCGPVPYGQAGTGICEILVDGLLVTQLVDSESNPIGSPGENWAHHADYLLDGSIVFEADWDGSQLWRLREGKPEPVRINASFTNDNTPCGLPGGYIASLWLERPGAVGASELKIMQSDGDDFAVLTPNMNVSSLSCHQIGK